MHEDEVESVDSVMYEGMVSHLGDFISQVRSDEEAASLYKSLENVKDRYINGVSIGKGGMKEILRVDDRMTGRPVAKAVMKNIKSRESVEQFIQEARLTARLEHPNIMPVYDIGLNELGQVFFTMKLVEGDNLGDILRNLRKKNPGYEKNYPLEVLLGIFVKVCDAVAYAHDKGILHLDLKPANIQVGDFGDVLVCDWGLSRYKPELKEATHEPIEYVSGQLTLDGQVFGSPGFMSPEQVSEGREALDHRSDIYSLGCLLYSLLTLKSAFSQKKLEDLLQAHADGDFIPPSERSRKRYIPAALEAVCLHAMKYDVSERYNRVVNLKDDVTSFMNGYATHAEKAGLLTRLFLLCMRHKVVVAFIVALLLVSISFLKVYKTQAKETQGIVRALGEEAKEKEQAIKEKELLELKSMLRLKYLFNPNFQLAVNDLKKRDFDKAARHLEDVGDENLRDYIELCRQLTGDYQERRLPVTKLLNLIKLLSKDLYTAIIEDLLRQEAVYLTYREKVDLCRQVLKIMNAGSPINFNVQDVLGKVYISLVGNKSLKYISALTLFSANYIDLNHTDVTDVGALRTMELTKLSLEGTQVKDLSMLNLASLKILNIKNTKLDDLSFLQESSLEDLNIAGLEVDCSELMKLETLRKVTIDKYNKYKWPSGVELIKESE